VNDVVGCGGVWLFGFRICIFLTCGICQKSIEFAKTTENLVERNSFGVYNNKYTYLWTFESGKTQWEEIMDRVVAVVLGGGRGSRLFPLTHERAKPAVPLFGK
jgi:hypothetical protein